MKIKFNYCLGGIIATAIIAITLFTTNTLTTNTSSSVKQPQEVIKVSYDWPYYPSVKELVDASDLIVIGKVIEDNKSVRNELKIMHNPNLPQEKKEKYEKMKEYEIVTESKIQISKVIKGEVNTNDNISVQQVGGIYENTKQEVADMKYLKKGDEIIIFLNKTPDNNIFVPVNMSQSHNYILNGKVKFNKDEIYAKELNTSAYEVLESEFVKYLDKNL